MTESELDYLEDLCKNCQNEQCVNCESSWKCKCKCNSGGVFDITQKVATTFAGFGMFAGGLALTVGTGGIAAPVILGGALMGAGVSSAYQGIEKSIKKERINASEYMVDVGFGAVTGVFTGGAGIVGESIAVNVVKESAMVGLKHLGVQAATGVVVGTGAKVINEVKECAILDKNWSDFGKTLDQAGDLNKKATVASWVSAAAVGSFGGVSSIVSSNCSSAVNNELSKAVTRVAINTATTAATDTIVQTTNIAVGAQESFDIKQTVTSSLVSSVVGAGQEGCKKVVHAQNAAITAQSKSKAISIKKDETKEEDEETEKDLDEDPDLISFDTLELTNESQNKKLN